MSTDPNPWFAVSVKSRWEKHTATLLRQKGYQEFNPLYKCRRKWSDRYRDVEMPLFPGYIFCRVGPDSHGLILTTPGVLRIVGMGGRPSAIEDSEVESVRTVIRSGLLAEPWPYLEAGRRVLIVDGPLRTAQGIFLEEQRNHKLVISISLLQRAVAVEIERDWAVPVGPVSVKIGDHPSKKLIVSRRIA